MSVVRDKFNEFLHHEHNQEQSEFNKNVLLRLEYLENRQKFSSRYSGEKTEINERDYISHSYLKQKLEAMHKVSLENLTAMEDNMKQHWEQSYQKMKSLENKLLSIFKEKDEAMTYLEYRVVGLENSQKNLSELMKRLVNNEAEKYAGVGIIEDRIKQVEHLAELRNEKQSDDTKIMGEQIKKYVIEQLHSVTQNWSTQQQGNEKHMLEDRIDRIEDGLDKLTASLEGIKHSKTIQNLKLNEEIDGLKKRSENLPAFPTQYNVTGDRYSRRQDNQSSSQAIIHRNMIEQLNSSSSENAEEQTNKIQPIRATGIRGLLTKSKEKGPRNKMDLRHEPLKPSNPLLRHNKLESENYNYLPNPRNLPPVKKDYKCLEERVSEQEAEERVIVMDEEGYLMDEQGNYYEDENGQRLTRSRLEEVMEQYNQY